jgi:FSR family fosmidomycin resistance protein-like MFS transporter
VAWCPSIGTGLSDYHCQMTSATLTSSPANSASFKQDAKVIGLVGLAHASSHFSHLLLPLMYPVFMKEFGLSFSELGLLMTVFFVVSGLGQATAGFVVDRFGARPVLYFSMCMFVLVCILASMATGYGWLMLVAVLAGLGNSPFHPVDFTILNQRVSPPRLGHAFSAHGLTGNLGWAVAPVFMVGITALSSWRTAYVAAALLYAGILLLLVLQREQLHTEVVIQHPGKKAGNDLAFMKLPVVWWCFAFFLLSTMTLGMVQNYAVSVLKAVHGVSFEAATMTLTAYMLCAALGIFVGGFVAARKSNSDTVVASCMTVAAVFLALCGTGIFGALGTMVVLAATGFAIGVGSPSRDMMIKKATPKGATGRVYGMVYSGFDVGFAVSPLVFGLLMDRGWYSATFFGAAIVLLLSVVAALSVGARVQRPVISA